MRPEAYVPPPHICTPNCFRVYRDGQWLKTRECNRKLRQDDIDEHNRKKGRRKL